MKRTANKKIRELIKATGYTQWEIAESLKIGESTFSRILRQELTTEHRDELLFQISKMGKTK